MFKQTFQQFIGSYRLELKQIIFTWGYLLLFVVWSGFITVSYTNNSLSAIRGVFNFTLGFSSLIGLFFAGIQVTRSERNKFDKLEVAFPTGSAVIFARWMATLTALCGLLIAPIGVSLVIPALQIDRDYMMLMSLLTVLSLTFITGIIWLVHSLFGIRRWMYPLFGGFWLMSGAIPTLIFHDGLNVAGTNLTNFIMMEAPNNSLWGHFILGQAPYWHHLFYIGLVALLAGIIHWRQTVNRFHRQPIVMITITFLALGVTLFSAFRYTSDVASANQVIISDRVQIQNVISTLTDPSTLPFAVKRYDLTLHHQDLSRLTAQMQVINRDEQPLTELTFSLHHQFDIISANLPFIQDNYWLTLTLPEPLAPQDEVTITLEYQGNLWIFAPIVGRLPEATDFIHHDGISLSYEILWYPVAGRVIPQFQFYRPDVGVIQHTLLNEPAEFYLTIESNSTLTFVSNLTPISDNQFTSSATTWVNLVGVRGLKTETSPDMTLIALEQSFDLIRSIVHQDYPPFITYLKTKFPDFPHVILQVLDLSTKGSGFYPSTPETLFIAISPYSIGQLNSNPDQLFDGYYRGQTLIIRLFGGNHTLLTNNIAYFIWTHYITDGDIEAMRPIIEEGLLTPRFHLSHNEQYQIASALYQIYITQGEDAVFAVLNEIRQHVDKLATQTPEDIIIWIEARADAER